MAEPVFALKIGCFTCFCLNGTERLEDLEHEFTYSPEQSPLSSTRSSRSTRRKRAHRSDLSEATPSLLGSSCHRTESSLVACPVRLKGDEAVDLIGTENGPTLLERRRLELPGTALVKGTVSTVCPKAQLVGLDEVSSSLPPDQDETVEPCEVPLVKKMDLSGSWVLKRVEGDMDAWLKDIGITWMMRSAGKAMNYGVGKMTNAITMTEDSIEITTWTPKGNHTSWLNLDGTDSRNSDPMDGRTMLAKARWEGTAIFIETRREDTGEVMPTSRRFLQDGEMCVEQITPSGMVARRWFALQ